MGTACRTGCGRHCMQAWAGAALRVGLADMQRAMLMMSPGAVVFQRG